MRRNILVIDMGKRKDIMKHRKKKARPDKKSKKKQLIRSRTEQYATERFRQQCARAKKRNEERHTGVGP